MRGRRYDRMKKVEKGRGEELGNWEGGGEGGEEDGETGE